MVFKRGKNRFFVLSDTYLSGLKGQVTLFIIIGLLIVGSVAVFMISKNFTKGPEIPASIQPVYASFLSCLEDHTLSGINLLESQGGYIYMPNFEPSSAYMPFSSQLDFLGSPIPYWYYVSGNNIAKEQVPTLQSMQGELATFLNRKARDCAFDSYYEGGFEIDMGEPSSQIMIKDGKVSVKLDMPLNITKAEETYLISSHNLDVSSNLKKLYDSALGIYSREQKGMFLENYTVDILRNYAPVDGVELTCSPLVWNADEVFSELQNAIEANILALKTRGGDFSLKKPENKYFIIDSDVNARFLTSKNWPSSFEVNPSRGALLISEPIGNQQGLGILGFCYVAYHFVYDIKYPVLVQVYEGSEFFQFPFAVVIKGNVPRTPIEGNLFEKEVPPEICEYSNTPVIIYVTDKTGSPLEANVSYECSGASCDIGKVSDGVLEASLPQCVNGNLVAKSSGFRDANIQYTSLEEGEVSIFLDKLYEKEINLALDSRNYSRQAIIHFISGDEIKTILYPAQKKVELFEGQYEVQVYIYENSSLTLPASNQKQCIDVPKSGVGTLFGLTEEKCFEYQIPSQIVSNALSGGGKENYYILESELMDSKSIEINAHSLPKPSSMEQLQTNYILFDEKGLDIRFE